jgi:CRISPR/Cas system CMR subunit Cmr4 (Cas7 group RAMP superfamily)
MTLDKLHRNQIAGIGQVVWPTYMVFKERLVLKKFDDIKIVHGTHNDFKQTIRHDMEEHGLLCPMVIDQDDQLRNGNHRFKILKKGNYADGSFFYKARSPEEVMFFSRLNVLCWELHPDMTQLMIKLWQGKMKKYTEKVPHLFTENVKSVNVKQ